MHIFNYIYIIKKYNIKLRNIEIIFCLKYIYFAYIFILKLKKNANVFNSAI